VNVTIYGYVTNTN